ncbi:hypothetical protein QQ045_026972 [Rhodiola kirilowii]
MEGNNLVRIQRKLGFRNGFAVDREGLSRGLAIWWDDELILGDFNEVLFSWESVGKRIRREWQMRRFREIIGDCALVDLGYKGSQFTFSNRREGDFEAKARLDRAFANEGWRKLLPDHELTFIRRDLLLKGNYFDLNPCGYDMEISLTLSEEDGMKVGDQLKRELDNIKSQYRSKENIEREASLSKDLEEWLLNKESCELLSASFTTVEIQDDVFQLGPTKAPGLDGFSTLFYERNWELVKDDVTKFALKFLNGGSLDTRINETLITLVPKVNYPENFSEYTPISLMNVLMKIITKAMANRLKVVLGQIISGELEFLRRIAFENRIPEGVARNLECHQNNKLIEGVKVSRSALMVSNLMFADDSIFFLKADVDNILRFKSILRHYEEVSG